MGRTLEWARRRAGMTQQELARTVGMPQSSIARIETGVAVPRSLTLIELLRATGHRLTVESVGPSVDREAIRRTLAMPVPRRTHRVLGRANREILRRLRRFGVPFVLIGELAEVVHGAPSTTNPGIEACHAATDVARERLAIALNDMAARKADARRLRLVTETAAGDGYETLARTAGNVFVSAGLLVRVAALEELVRVRLAGRLQEDREAAALLRAIEDMRWDFPLG